MYWYGSPLGWIGFDTVVVDLASTNRSDVVTRLISRVGLNGWGNTEGRAWVGAQVSQPNWGATVATRGSAVLEKAAVGGKAAAEEKAPPLREATSGANCLVATPVRWKGSLPIPIARCVHHPTGVRACPF